ncbi:MAG: ATP-binding protein [Leptospiraceae bacterium]|nr:ATP-binding protein [Leptospiraceae bacterium]
MVLKLSSFEWIKRKYNLIISGPTGTGKSYLACAFGNNACLEGYSVLYYNSSKLFNSLRMKKVDGSYNREIDKIKKTDLLILDDFGLEPFDKKTALFLMEIIEDRHGQKSTIITSQYPISSWHDVVNNQTIADAVCDRILHSSYTFTLKGDSMRKLITKGLT